MDRNRRKELRIRRRFSCELHTATSRHVGAILDLSHHGLFVQTRLQPRSQLRIPLDVKLRLPALDAELALSTELVRHFRVPAALLVAAGGGLGLAIRRAPDAWADFVYGLSPHALLSRQQAVSAPRRKATPAGCLLCGAQPPAGASFCGRCRLEERRSA